MLSVGVGGASLDQDERARARTWIETNKRAWRGCAWNARSCSRNQTTCKKVATDTDLLERKGVLHV